MDKSKALQKATLGGSFLAAIVASLCCIGPLIAALLGIGGFAVSAFFEKWRPLLLAATFALLGLAWFLTYRKPKAACEEGSACATKPSARWTKVVLWLATAVILITAAFPYLSSALFGGSGSASPVIAAGPNSALLKVRIPSMDCAACAVSIQKKLRELPGVERAEVSFETKEAVVQYDGVKLSSEKITAAIDETGFKAETFKE